MSAERYRARNAAIVALCRAGFSTYAVAEMFGVTQPAVWSVLKRRGYTKRRLSKADPRRPSAPPPRAAGARQEERDGK